MRRPPPWIALVPLAAAAVVLGIGISEGVRERAKPAPEVVWVEPAAVVLDDFPDWADPRWRDEIEALLAAWPPFPVGDATALPELRADLEALSFLADVDPPSVDRTGGLRLGFVLRRPVAALQGPEGFLTVAADGVVLSGRWPAPPLFGDLWLPVILPHLAGGGDDPAAADFAFDFAAPGDWLVEPEHLAAIDTAVSLARHLRPDDRARLGRAAIDGAGFDVRGPHDLGVLIGLEDGRWIAFGRPPSSDAPGELAPELKWAAVSRALAARAEPGDDGAAWELADVRWDVPELGFSADASARIAARLERTYAARETGFPGAWRTDGSGDDLAPTAPTARPGSRAAEPRTPARPAGIPGDHPRVR